VSEGTQSGKSKAWRWPDSLDALSAAPNYHRLLFENERVRVLEVRIPPGHFVPVHTHRWASFAYVLSNSDFLRRDAEKNILFDSRTAVTPPSTPAAQWLDPMPPHSVENIGNAEIVVIITELKDSAERK
jgi:hypothetical protein